MITCMEYDISSCMDDITSEGLVDLQKMAVDLLELLKSNLPDKLVRMEGGNLKRPTASCTRSVTSSRGATLTTPAIRALSTRTSTFSMQRLDATTWMFPCVLCAFMLAWPTCSTIRHSGCCKSFRQTPRKQHSLLLLSNQSPVRAPTHNSSARCLGNIEEY